MTIARRWKRALVHDAAERASFMSAWSDWDLETTRQNAIQDVADDAMQDPNISQDVPRQWVVDMLDDELVTAREADAVRRLAARTDQSRGVA